MAEDINPDQKTSWSLEKYTKLDAATVDTLYRKTYHTTVDYMIDVPDMDITADGRPLSVRMRGPLLTSFEYATPDKVVATIQDAYPAIIDRVVSAIWKDTGDTLSKDDLSVLLSDEENMSALKAVLADNAERWFTSTH